MNREIKFRGKSVSTGEWVYGGYYNWGDKPYIIQKDVWDKSYFMAHMIEVDPKTVNQFAFITDRNGKEMYENDIIEYESYDGKTYRLQAAHLKYFHHWQETEDNETVRVIGNVHDNPELLNK